MRQGIVLVSFGTTEPQGERGLQRIESFVQKAFPDSPVGRAYTSRFIRRKLATANRPIDSPGQALRRMLADHCRHILIWPLFVTAGAEYQALASQVESLRGSIRHDRLLTLAAPLLQAGIGPDRIAEALLRQVPSHRRREDAVIVVAHGRKRERLDPGYEKVMARLRQQAGNFYLAALEGSNSLAELLPTLREAGIRKAFLLPFLLVMGRHVSADLAGPEPDSWTSVLAANGIGSEVLCRCIATSDELLHIWLKRVKPLVATRP